MSSVDSLVDNKIQLVCIVIHRHHIDGADLLVKWVLGHVQCAGGREDAAWRLE